MCSVVTNLVTSLEFKPIRFATTLCHFGRSRNGYVSTRFIRLSRTAASGYVVVLERFGQNEELATSKNEERTKKKPNFFPSSGFRRCNMKTYVNMNFIHHFYVFYLMYSSIFRAFFVISPYRKTL